MAAPRELAEQWWGEIPGRVGVVVLSCGVKALNARTCEQERRCHVRRGPRARQTSPEGAFSLAALAGRGGHQGRDRVVCAFWLRGLICVLRFLRNEVGFPGCLGDPQDCPRQMGRWWRRGHVREKRGDGGARGGAEWATFGEGERSADFYMTVASILLGHVPAHRATSR
jgi:hypothetical protein